MNVAFEGVTTYLRYPVMTQIDLFLLSHLPFPFPFKQPSHKIRPRQGNRTSSPIRFLAKSLQHERFSTRQPDAEQIALRTICIVLQYWQSDSSRTIPRYTAGQTGQQ
jgi:hypothetical protein